MSEEKQVKKQLIKNMILNLITFSIIFTILGTIIYGQFKNSLYKSADEELTKSANMQMERQKEKDIKSFNMPFNQDFVNEEKFESPRIIRIERDDKGNSYNNTGFNEIFKNVKFDSNTINSIYEINVENYSYRGINYKNSDGTYTQVLINVDSEKDIADQFIKNLTISFSITVLVILVASYVLSKRTLKPIIESWKKQTQFVQDASHELRTPLTIIKAKQESLLENPESTIMDNAEDISITLQETQRLTKLIKELMELAKNDSDKITLNKEIFKLDDELKSIINLYKEVAETDEKHMKLSLNYNENINADLNKIKELIVILLDNSLKYTEPKDDIEVKTYWN